MEDQERAKIIDRVLKLKNQAEDTAGTTEHEAQAFAAAMQTGDLAALYKRFNVGARYYPEMPGGPKYGIQMGSRCLLADDTHELFEKFVKAVRDA